MKKVKSSFFELNLGVAALAFAVASSFPANVAQANAGFGGGTDITGKAIDVPTFFASSPQGIRPAYDPAIHGLSPTLTVDTGTPIRKFVDPLGGVYNGLENLPGMTDLQSGMPVGIPESNWLNPFNGVQTKDDYYEIAVVEYTERLATDMMKATRLRGYVQIETANMVAKGLKDITGVIGSEHIAATYPDGSPIRMRPATRSTSRTSRTTSARRSSSPAARPCASSLPTTCPIPIPPASRSVPGTAPAAK